MKIEWRSILTALPVICVAIELVLLTYYEFFTYTGWLYTILFWPIYVVGAAAAIFAIAKYRIWMMMLPLVMLAAPLLFGAMFLYQCSRGNCI